MAQASDVTIEHLLRELRPQVLGIVVRRFRDFAAAEDAVQEASIGAALQWPRDGVPENPRAWLTQVAFRKMADQIRSESARRRRETEVAEEAARAPEAPAAEIAPQDDDTLVLLFMCCHPALTPASAIALTLRAVGGLTTAEIAHAFLVPEATMAQRISRPSKASRNPAFHSSCRLRWNEGIDCAPFCTSCISFSMRATRAAQDHTCGEPTCRTKRCA